MTKLSPDDAEFLSRLNREPDLHPAAFARGAELIERSFSYAVQRRNLVRQLKRYFREQREIEADPLQNIIVKLELEELRGMRRGAPGREYRRCVLPRETAGKWMLGLSPLMDRTQAEAVVLIVAAFYRGIDEPQSSLPQVLRRPPRGTRGLSEHEEDLVDFTFSTEHIRFEADLMRLARCAWARVRSGPFESQVEQPPAPIQLPSSTTSRDSIVIGKPALTKQEVLFVQILLEEDGMVWVSSEEWCDRYDKRRKDPLSPAPAESDLRSRIVPRLKEWGLDSEGRRGYRFPPGCAARVYFGASG